MRWDVFWAVFGLLMGLAFPLSAQSQPRGAPATFVENENAYLARCRRETIAQSAGSQAQADSICKARWEQIRAAGPLADIILNLAPALGTGFDPALVKSRLAAMGFPLIPRQGTLASGKMRDIDFAVTGAPSPGMSLNWFREGEPIPFDLQGALSLRGASLAMIACQYFGSSEGTRLYRVTAGGKAPFALRVATLEAAVASQSSTFTAAADFSGAMPSLAQLRKDGSEWTAACPQ